MPTGSHTQSNFTAGEISPRLLGRTDIGQYKNGVSVLRNFIPQKHGGVANRTGTKYVAEAKNSGTTLPTVTCCGAIGDSGEVDTSHATYTQVVKTRLIPFQFSIGDAFILEFGDHYVRFFKDDGQVLSGTPYEVATVYGGEELDEIKFTQSADVLYLCHPNHQTRKLIRTTDTNWNFSVFSHDDGPYGPINTDDTKTLAVSALTLKPATVTLTATGFTPFVADDAAGVDHEGTWVRLQSGGSKWGVAEIVGFTSSSQVTVELRHAPDSTSASDTWRMGQWSGPTGWPWSAAFHDGRLWFAGHDDWPQTVWASTTDNFNVFQPSDPTNSVVSDGDGLNFTINDDQVNAVRWMISTAKGLLLGTSGGEFLAKSNDTTSGISPSNIEIRRQSTYGSKPNPTPIQVGNAALFVQRHGRKLREMAYSFQQDQHESLDLTLISEHITENRLKWLAYSSEPSPVVWAVDEVGGLLSMTYDSSQEVIAWSKHVLGGTDVAVESIAVIPGDDEDRLWMVVKRTIDGDVVRYVERLTDPFEEGDTLLRDAIFLDSSLTYDGWNTTICEQMILDETTPGSGWLDGDTGTLNALCHTPFSVASVDRVYRFDATPDADEVTPIDVKVTAYVDTDTVNVQFLTDVPAALQATATYHWALTASTITGLSHLEGEEVGVLVDGGTHANVTISGGEADLTLGEEGIEFQTYAGVAQIGLPYESDLVSLPVVAELGFDSKGRTKSVYKTHFRFYNTVNAEVGTPENGLDAVPFRDSEDLQGVNLGLFTGLKTIDIEGSYAEDVKVEVKQVDPLPITLLSTTYELDINSA